MCMNKGINVRTVAIMVLLVAIISSGTFILSAFAANSRSIDLEHDSEQYLRIDDASQTGLDVAGDFTIEAWIKPESLPDGDIVTKIQGSDFSYGFNLRDTGKLLIEYIDSGGSTSVETSDAEVTTGAWHHVAASCDVSVALCDIYVNGSQVATSSISANASTTQNTSAPFMIGARLINSSSSEKEFDGLIDDVRMWSVIRTGAQIADNMDVELNGSESGLVGYWKLNDSLADSTGNGNALTNINSAQFSEDVPFSGVANPSVNTFVATPGTIAIGQNSTLSWNVSDATLVSIDNGIGNVSASSTTAVSPETTTTYTLTASNQGLATSTAQVTVMVSAAVTAVRKSTDESVTNSTSLQNDDELAVTVLAGKTYVVEGMLVASSTSGTPDIKIALTSPSGSSMAVGHVSAAGAEVDGGVLQASGSSSGARVHLPASVPTPIIIRGTVVVTNSGTLQLQWAQFASNANAVIVGKGSYLKVEEL